MEINSMCLAEFLVDHRSTIRDALSKIDSQGTDQVFMVDDFRKLLGAVTQEHIRRALLRGDGIDAPLKPLGEPVTVKLTPQDGRAEALDLMRTFNVREIPVVDGDGRVAGVHVDRAVVGAPKLPNWAVIMAGGKGTRLAPLTNNIPKPMLPVAGRPIIERLVLHLVGAGVGNIFISVNYLADIIEKHFGDGSRFGCRIDYLREDTEHPLGTGGALRLLSDLGYTPPGPVLVMNGDLITGFSVPDLLRAHQAASATATIAVGAYEHQVPFGVIESADGRLSRIVEKPRNTWAVNAGIYVIEPHLIARIPANELFPITDLFEDCLRRGEPVGLWALADLWQDIGRPAELARARGIA